MENKQAVENEMQISSVVEGKMEILPSENEKMSYCSFKPSTQKEAGDLYNAIINPQHRLSEFINKTIEVKDVYAESIDCVDETTGEVKKAVRVVLLDKNFNSYQCVSGGVYQAVLRLASIYGNPTWENPIPVQVLSIDKGAKRILSLAVDTSKMK